MRSPRPDARSLLFGREGIIVCLTIFALSTLIFLPIFWHGFPNGIDADRHYRWTLQFSEALAEPGVFYPRWLGSANNFQGSPATLFYPPLTFYVAAAFNLLFPASPVVLTLSCWLSLFLSGLSFYGFVRSFSSLRTGLLAAACYVIIPYHLFDLFQGGSIAEYWAFVWLPMIFHGVGLVIRQPSGKRIVYLALSYALLLFTHVPTAFLITLILPVYGLLLTRDWKALARLALAVILGASLSAIFVMPLLLERDGVRTEAVLKLDYNQFFLFTQTRQAMKSRFFAHDLSDYENNPTILKPSDFRFLIKTEQTAAGTLLLFLMITILLVLQRTRIRQDRSLSTVTAALWIITLLALLMTSKASAVVWQMIPKLSHLQLPSRWLVIASFGICALLAAAFSVSVPMTRARVAVLSLVVVAVFSNLIVSLLLIVRAPYDANAFQPAVLFREVPEYRPVWWDNQLHEQEVIAPCSVIAGEATVDAIDSEGSHQQYVITADTDAVLKFRTLFFPGWVAEIDGQDLAVAPSEEGRMRLSIAAGRHDLTLRFEDTQPRRAGKILSAISLLLVCAALVFPRRRLPSLTPSPRHTQNKAE